MKVTDAVPKGTLRSARPEKVSVTRLFARLVRMMRGSERPPAADAVTTYVPMLSFAVAETRVRLSAPITAVAADKLAAAPLLRPA